MSGLVKSTHSISIPPQCALSRSIIDDDDDQGTHVTSHSEQWIWMPTRKLPNSPQFQHSLGSAPCWPVPICFRHLPRSSPYHANPSGPQRSLMQFRRNGNGVTGIFPSSLLRNISVHGTRRAHTVISIAANLRGRPSWPARMRIGWPA